MPRLDEIDLSPSLSREESERQIERLQRRLLHLRLIGAGLLDVAEPGPGVCVVFEGWDASGKGGAIKRLVARLDPRHVRVAPFGAPSEQERRRHFLLRFAPELPGRGEMSIFDRSWYGRVLVERVEGFATPNEWRRAFGEIVNFERALVEEGTTLVKFWLHISAEEQLRRFESRRTDPLRAWKLTDEDWRNRERRADYLPAIEEMLERTDHAHSPWELIAAEDKRYARVAVLETVIARIEAGLRCAGIEPPPSKGSDFDRKS
jgi:AMP-polyphosphate phosphotransferase